MDPRRMAGAAPVLIESRSRSCKRDFLEPERQATSLTSAEGKRCCSLAVPMRRQMRRSWLTQAIATAVTIGVRNRKSSRSDPESQLRPDVLDVHEMAWPFCIVASCSGGFCSDRCGVMSDRFDRWHRAANVRVTNPPTTLW
jgi:hypothetical protein